MSKIQAFEQFLATSSVQLPVVEFVVNFLLAAVLASILGMVYIKFGNSLSNRKTFSRNFVLITMTTMLIITIVKSSLALSLGLVGALSIVRFRTALKEPEELSYLFLCIAMGLGLGADQRTISLTAFFIIISVIILKKIFYKSRDNNNMHIIISCLEPDKVDLQEVISALKKYCQAVDLKRFDETQEMLEAAFLVEIMDFADLNEAKMALQKMSRSIKVSFLDNKHLY
ncbi:MAG: DUF4956 domain-containing protein [bacterium]|nr:DUF4956 domain-containing protein [bacterium]